MEHRKDGNGDSNMPTYRVGKKGMYILLSNSCLVLPAVVMQQQEEIYRNPVPSLFATSVGSDKLDNVN